MSKSNIQLNKLQKQIARHEYVLDQIIDQRNKFSEVESEIMNILEEFDASLSQEIERVSLKENKIEMLGLLQLRSKHALVKQETEEVQSMNLKQMDLFAKRMKNELEQMKKYESKMTRS